MSNWGNVGRLPSKDYICGYCSTEIASETGWSDDVRQSHIYFCHKCQQPTFFNTLKQTPGATYGSPVLNIDDKNVLSLYNEARRCISSNSFTASVLCCRKLLMHIAVHKGAKEGLNFIEYVEYLSTNNFIPPDAKDWVDIIRQKGNEANHQINLASESDAKDLIDFSELLLKLIYEYPAKVRMKVVSK